MNRRSVDSFRRKYNFPWEAFDIVIRGKSSIDSKMSFGTHNSGQVSRYVHSYGFDLDNPIEYAELLGNLRESINFIRRYFLQPDNSDGLRLEVPRKILELGDVRDLFLMASLSYPGQTGDSQGVYLKNWACSVLKVMHTVAHIDKDLRTNHFAEIQKQIFDRFYKVVCRDHEGRLFLGRGADDPEKVELVAFETKPKKTRDSILLKLLHKPENVAEDIFDRVGVRFITPTCLGALMVVKYLTEKLIVMAPNIKPSRSRNTLIDLDQFRTRYETALFQLEHGELSEEGAVDQIMSAAQPAQSNPDNPHSSEYYRSIQVTGRQLIKLKNPLYDDLKELKSLARNKPVSEEMGRIIERIDLKHTPREVRFFYPFEVQIMDEKSAEENERGRSAHSEYKKAQIQTALRRVMGSLSDAAR